MTTLTEDKVLLEQVERILHSDGLRTSEVLRRLFKFLAEKSVSGEADELKEYTVAIDGMGKPTTYDPRHDAAVRIQVGRLRQKLADYYRTEGQEDPVIIDIPKGRFRLCYELRPEPALLYSTHVFSNRMESSPENIEVEHDPRIPFTYLWTRVLWIATLVVIFMATCVAGLIWNQRAKIIAQASPLTPELKELWDPFINSKRPIIIANEDPYFVEFDTGSGFYVRDKNVDSWKDVANSPGIMAVHKAMKDVDMEPSTYYTSFGQVNSSFLIGKFLGPLVQNLYLSKASELTWRQMADNNVLFLGIPYRFFAAEFQPMPIALQLSPAVNGVRDLHPELGHPDFYEDKFKTAPSEEGSIYALVTHSPGPVGGNDIESFTSRRASGYVAALKAFSDPDSARIIVDQLKKHSGGRMPRYYQLLFRVTFKKEIPLKTDVVLARELK